MIATTCSAPKSDLCAKFHLARPQKDQPRKAIDDLQTSLRIDDRQTSALIGLGEAYVKTRDFACAKSMFDRAIQLDPISPEAYFLRGRLMESLGNQDQASSD